MDCKRRWFVVLCAALLLGGLGQAVAQENIGGSSVTNVVPSNFTAGQTGDLTFTANVISPDFEYMDRIDLDLPDGWTVNLVSIDSLPPANGCGGALPPVSGVEAGNVVYWQSTGYPPATNCGAWSGGTAGTNFDFIVNVTVPSCTGAPWDVSWNIIGDGWGGTPHSASGIIGPITCEGGGGAAITLDKTVGTTPGVCATTDTITVATGTEVYYCYVAENTGDVTFEFHTLVDDELGTVLEDFPYTLAPGALSPEVIVPYTVTAPVVNTATWTAVDSIGGYTVDDTIPFNFEDISATGTAFTLPDDGTFQIPIGFTFDFYGSSYTSFWISSNGFMSDIDHGSGCCTGDPLPDPGTPNGTIAGWWEDLDPAEPGAVLYYETLGTAPNQYLVVTFQNVQHYPSGNPVTLQYKLFEDGTIEVHYQDAPGDGTGTHSAGIENQDGTIGIQYYLGLGPLTTPVAVRYAPTVTQEASAQDTATVNISDPDIDVTPASLAASQLVGTTTQQVLTIGNTGSATLDWTIDEAPPNAATTFPPMPNPSGYGGPAPAAEVLGQVGEFKVEEDHGLPITPWDAPQVVLYDNGPLVTHPGGGAGGADASALQTALGMGTYGFGHQVSAGNRVADDFTVTDANWTIETITFFAYQTGSSTTSTITAVNLQIWDGPPDNPASTVVWGDPTTNVMTGTTWMNAYRVLDTGLTDTARPIMANTVTVNAVLPAGTYWLDWQTDGTLTSGPWAPPVSILGQTTTGNSLQSIAGVWAPLVDVGPQGLPFIIEGTSSSCNSPSDIPWLSASPTAGSTPAAGSSNVDVTFDATVVPVGIYDALLCVFSNDPDEPLVEVPVQMEVVIPVELMGIEIE